MNPGFYFLGFLACLIGIAITFGCAYLNALFGEWIAALGFIGAMVLFVVLAVQARERF